MPYITDKILEKIHKEKNLNTKATHAWGYQTSKGTIFR